MPKKIFEYPVLYPKQIEFCKSKFLYTLYGGMRGGGKSFVLRIKLIDLALKYPGIHILIMRRTYPELEENHVKPLKILLKHKQEGELARYNEKNKEFIFENGSIIKLGSCQHEKDIDVYQGHQYQVIAIDEATHFTEYMFMRLTECLRLDSVLMSTDKEYEEKWKNFKCRMYLTANPGGVGHLWVKRLFIDKKYKNKEKPENYCYIPCSVFENKFIVENDPEYIERLEALPEKERKAMLEGDWNVFEGLYFEEFDEALHVYDPQEIQIQPNFRKFRVRDYGLDMLACYFIAMDEFGNCYVYKELYQSNLTVKQSGDFINSNTLPSETPYLDILPPDLWNRQSQTGKSAADILMQECNQYPTKANNDFYVGCMLTKEFLQINEQTGFPRLRISKNCPNLIHSISLIQHDEKNVNVYAKEPHELTHAVDAIRYFCTSYTFAPDPEQIRNIANNYCFANYALNLGEYEEEEDYNEGFFI